MWELDPIVGDSFIIEAKARKKIALLYDALAQAEAACKGSYKKPAAIVKADHKPILFVARWDDVLQWVRALAEVGSGQQIKAYVRQMRRVLDEMEGKL